MVHHHEISARAQATGEQLAQQLLTHAVWRAPDQPVTLAGDQSDSPFSFSRTPAWQQDKAQRLALASLQLRFLTHCETRLASGHHGTMGFDVGSALADLLINYCGLPGLLPPREAADAREQRLARADVERADALFLCNAVRGILEVARLGDRVWSPDPRIARLRGRADDPAPAVAWGHALVGMVRAAADQWLASRPEMKRQVLADQLADLAWAGLATTVTAPVAFCTMPRTTSAAAVWASLRCRAHTAGIQSTLTIPVSSSRLTNVTPCAVAGRCRWVTAPATNTRVPSGTDSS